MHKIMAEIKEMCDVKETLMKWVKSEVDKGQYGAECCDAEALGSVVDMVKDLSEAAADCMKKKYYEMMICAAMTTGEDMEEAGRMGYDNWRYPSSGKFAKKGQGTNVGHGANLRMGFVDGNPWPPYVDPYMDPNMQNPEWVNFPMGYDERRSMRGNGNDRTNSSDRNRTSDSRSSQVMGYPMDEVWKYGEDFAGLKGTPYDDYRMAKKHYTETHKEEDHHKMNEKIANASVDMISSMGEMWEDANPETRKKVEENMRTLLKQWEKK